MNNKFDNFLPIDSLDYKLMIQYLLELNPNLKMKSLSFYIEENDMEIKIFRTKDFKWFAEINSKTDHDVDFWKKDDLEKAISSAERRSGLSEDKQLFK